MWHLQIFKTNSDRGIPIFRNSRNHSRFVLSTSQLIKYEIEIPHKICMELNFFFFIPVTHTWPRINYLFIFTYCVTSCTSQLLNCQYLAVIISNVQCKFVLSTIYGFHNAKVYFSLVGGLLYANKHMGAIQFCGGLRI